MFLLGTFINIKFRSSSLYLKWIVKTRSVTRSMTPIHQLSCFRTGRSSNMEVFIHSSEVQDYSRFYYIIRSTDLPKKPSLLVPVEDSFFVTLTLDLSCFCRYPVQPPLIRFHFLVLDSTLGPVQDPFSFFSWSPTSLLLFPLWFHSNPLSLSSVWYILKYLVLGIRPMLHFDSLLNCGIYG